MKTLFCTIILFLLLNNIVKAQVYVNVNAAGNNDGSSWQNAYTNLDSALRHTTSGEIWVCQGVYKPSRNPYPLFPFKSFLIDKPVQLLGGFNGTEVSAAQRDYRHYITILSGDLGIPENTSDNTACVVMIHGLTLDSTTKLDGFTITKAWYNDGPGIDSDNGAVHIYNAGMYNFSGPVVRNCTITGNFGFTGAGIYIYASSPYIIDNTISNNKACVGAGIYMEGGAGAPVISGNRIIFNTAMGPLSIQNGGGIYIAANISPVITANLIENNYAFQDGAGIYSQGGQPRIMNNIISNNSSRRGGGITVEDGEAAIINNLVVNNHVTTDAGAIYLSYTNGRFINNTVVNNSSASTGGAMRIEGTRMPAVNNIIYNNHSATGKPIIVSMGPVDHYPGFRYCDVEGGVAAFELVNTTMIDSIWKEGNIATLPQFTDTSAYNFHLLAASASIDAGDPDTSQLGLPPTDIPGNPRIFNNRIDIGCYEAGSAANIYYLHAIPDSVNLAGWRDSSFDIHVQSNTAWNIYNPASWINITSTEGNGYTTVQATAVKNPSLTTGRIGNLLLSGTNTSIPSIPIRIDQSNGGYFFIPDTLYIDGNVNDTASFIVNTNLIWYIGSYPTSWLQFNVINGQSGLTVIAKVKSANITNTVRQGLITIHFGNTSPGQDKNIVVIQAMAATKLCPGGSTVFNAGLTGASYQWQQDTGNGFANIIDNTNYSGTNTAALHLNNIPSSFYGFRYRCLVESAFSNVYSIQFENKWTGAVSQAWENPANWSCGVLPDSNTDVVIFAGTVIISSNTTIRKLTVNNSFATVIVQAGVNLVITH